MDPTTNARRAHDIAVNSMDCYVSRCGNPLCPRCAGVSEHIERELNLAEDRGRAEAELPTADADTVAARALGGTEFFCPKCQAFTCWGTDCGGPEATWTGGCYGPDEAGCTFTWPRTDDAKYFRAREGRRS